MKLLINTVIGATLLTSTQVMANVNSYYDYARVKYVEPVYQWVEVSRPQQECHSYYRKTYNTHNNATGTVVGAIIGGAIGNAIGHNKSNKKVGLIAGAALGGAIGHDVSRQQPGQVHYKKVRNCEVVYQDVEQVKEVRGYNVTYSYRGETLRTFMHRHPGKKLKIKVSVSPSY